MPKHHDKKMPTDSAEINIRSVITGKVDEHGQLTVADTGWREEEKERMKKFGYDGLDMVKAWYS